MSGIGIALAYAAAVALVVPLGFSLFKTQYRYFDVVLAAISGGALSLIPTVGGVASIAGTVGILYWRIPMNALFPDIVASVAAARLALLVALLWNHASSNARDDLHNLLVQITGKISEGLPTMVDEGVRFESSKVGPGNNLTNLYTLVSRKREDLVVDRFKKELETPVRSESCTNKQIRKLLDKGATMTYRYQDKEGAVVAELVVRASDCGG